jgi:hypothetical protein
MKRKYTRRAVVVGALTSTPAAAAGFHGIHFAGGGTPIMLPHITGIMPTSSSVVGGSGSAGRFVANMGATLSSGTFAGTFSTTLGGADAGSFVITSGGVLSVGGSDLTPGSYP